MTNETVVSVVKFRLGEIDEELAAAKRRLQSVLKRASEEQSQVDELTAGAKELREWLDANSGTAP